MGRSTWPFTNPQGKKYQSKFLKKSPCLTSLPLKESPKRYTYSNWFNTQISFNFMRLSKRSYTFSLSCSTAAEESCSTISQTKKSSIKLIKINLKRSADFYIKSSMESAIWTARAFSTETEARKHAFGHTTNSKLICR